ncbi:MAG: hypothetical protein MK213_07675, partial [Planctomycetes bacterium]|nr:hypothetical protein [Planctomycetota bacterium]
MLRSVILGLGFVSCAGPSLEHQVLADPTAGLSMASLNGDRLRPSALVAELSFLFPMETRALRRTLLRDEISRMEAQRLELEAPSALIQEALATTLVGIEEEFGGAEAWRPWGARRVGLPPAPVRRGRGDGFVGDVRFKWRVGG